MNWKGSTVKIDGIERIQKGYSISKEMKNDNSLKFAHSWTKLCRPLVAIQ